MSQEGARRVIPLSDGNLTRAVKIYREEEDELFFLEKFVQWMRLCYLYDAKGIYDFVLEIGKLGREKQKNFLAYAQRIIRNALLINFNNPQLAKLNQEEQEFLVNFGRFINHTNIIQYNEELEKAQLHIERNANPNILFMDISLTFAVLLQAARKAHSNI